MVEIVRFCRERRGFPPRPHRQAGSGVAYLQERRRLRARWPIYNELHQCNKRGFGGRVTAPPELDPNFSQAERIIERLGGMDHLMELLAYVGHPINLCTLYRWTYPKERGGTGGLIPTHMWPVIFQAARCEGIILGPEDLDPRPMPRKVQKNDRVLRNRIRKVVQKRMRRQVLQAKKRAEKTK